MTNPELTVSIVTFKTPLEDLRHAVQDLLSAVPSAYIVIADNDSGTDYLGHIESEFSSNGQVLVLSTGENRGYGFGHNFAVRHCPDSGLHLVMNADIHVKPEALHALLGAMRDRDDVGLMVPKLLNPDGSLQALNKRNPTVLDMLLRFLRVPLGWIPTCSKRMAYYEMRDVGYDHETDVSYASGCFMLFNRACFDRIGGFDERFFMYLEDADITRRIAAESRAVYFPGCSVTHTWNRAAHSQLKYFFWTLHSMFQYFSKWGWKFK